MKVGDSVIRVFAGSDIAGTIVREDDDYWYFEQKDLPSIDKINDRLKPVFEKLGLNYPELTDTTTPYWTFLKSNLHEVDIEIGWDGITKTGSYIKPVE